MSIFDNLKVTIDDVELTAAEKMTLHVALQNFASYLQEEDVLGDDYHGNCMRKAYIESVLSITKMIVDPKPKGPILKTNRRGVPAGTFLRLNDDGTASPWDEKI